MHRLVSIGQAFFAIGLIGLGIDHFIFEQFVTGRAPAWPDGVPGRLVWAYSTGIVFVAVGVIVLTRKYGRVAAIAAAALVFLWALLRHVAVVVESAPLSAAWTQAGKALVLTGGTLSIAAMLPPIPRLRSPFLAALLNSEREFIIAGRLCLGLFLILAGVQHFLYTEFVASLIPRWFPGDTIGWTLAAGLALMTGGVGLLVPHTARLAALLSGLMVFSWFWIVHIPRALTSVSDGIAVFEALSFSGILLAIAGRLGEEQLRSTLELRRDGARIGG
jgi:uncharacterized membrane protein